MFLASYTVAMVTYYVLERTTTCSPMIGQCFDTMNVASSDKEWLQRHIEILELETVLSHLKPHFILIIVHSMQRIEHDSLSQSYLPIVSIQFAENANSWGETVGGTLLFCPRNDNNTKTTK